MKMKQWLRQLTQSSEKRALPLLSYPCISLLGTTVKELTNDGKLQAEGMRLVAERTPSAAAVSMMDLSVEAEAFGAKIKGSDYEVPTVTGAVVSDKGSADALPVPSVGAGRAGKYVEAIGKAVSLITDRPVFAGVIGPFSLAGRLMDVSEALVACYTDPETVHIVLEKSVLFLFEYIKAYKSAGANGIIMAEPLAGLLSPEMAEIFSEPYVRRLAEETADDDFIIIYHNCGDNTVKITESILRTGCSAYHFGNSVSMLEVLQKLPPDVIAMGNIDPVSQFRSGTPDSVYAQTKKLLEECGAYPNFVLSSGCDIPPCTPWENIDAFFAAAEQHRAQQVTNL